MSAELLKDVCWLFGYRVIWLAVLFAVMAIPLFLKQEHRKHLAIYFAALFLTDAMPPDPFAEMIGLATYVVSTFILWLFLRFGNAFIQKNKILITCVLYVLTIALCGFGLFGALVRMLVTRS